MDALADRLLDRVAERIVVRHEHAGAQDARPRYLGGNGAAALGGARPRARAREERGARRGAIGRQDRAGALGPRDDDEARRARRRTVGRRTRPQHIEEPRQVGIGAALAPHPAAPSQFQSSPVASASRSFDGPNVSRSRDSVSGAMPAGFEALYARQASGSHGSIPRWRQMAPNVG